MAAADLNIDTREIAKFDAVASLWWDKKGAFRALHDINETRVAYIDQRVRVRGKHVLDVGCGGGILAEAMAALGAVVTGIDMGQAALAAARKHMETSGYEIEYRRTSAEKLAEVQPGGYEVVTCMELLEHVPDPGSLLSACKKLVKPSGDVFCATLNRTFLSYLLAIVAAEHLLGLIPRGTHRYSRFIKPVELVDWARDAGLHLQDLSGLHYFPFFRRCRSGGHRLVNYMAHFYRGA